MAAAITEATPAVVGASAPADLHALLAGPVRAAEPLAVLPAAVYLDVGDDVLAVVASDALHLPNALVVGRPAARAPWLPLDRSLRATVGAGVVTLGPLVVRPTRWRRTTPVGPLPATGLAVGVRDLRAALAVARPQLPAVLRGAVEDLEQAAGPGATQGQPGARVKACADRLLGLGPGLTPAGDDVLAGLMVGWLHLRGRRGPATQALAAPLGAHVVATATARTTALSAALLRRAATGAAVDEVHAVLRAVASGAGVDVAVARLLTVGHTSGVALAHGLRVAAETTLAGHREAA